MTQRWLSELGWLPSPPADWRQRVKTLDAAGAGLGTGAQLRQLATYALDGNQLTRLAARMELLRDCEVDLAPLTPFRLGLLSNATTQLVTPALVASALRQGIALEVVEAPYDQALQTALDPQSPLQCARPDAVLIAIDVRGLPLRASLGSPSEGRAAVEKALGQLAAIRSGIQRGCGAPCIVQSLARLPESLFGSFDLRLAGTARQLIDTFNRALVEQLDGSDDLLLDVARLAEDIGLADWHDPVQWHLAKLPFAQELVPLYADHVARLVGALRGKARRCLVLDLDNTLWGGVVADDGVDGLALGQGDPLGEAFLEVQRVALALRERGVVLAVCSKNTDANAVLPFRTHPDMLLREDHIAVFQANFRDKASNLKAIADTLQLGLESLVLLDDNPAEREQVRVALPAVAVPELSGDPALYARTLLAAGYFEATTYSAEDRSRADMYGANAQRVAVREQVADLESYLRSLDMELTIAPFDKLGRDRITQLVNKSNQFNLTTRRYTAPEIAQLEQDPAVRAWQIRLADRFGDNGMICVVVCRASEQERAWEIDTWLMSCRVLGRRVEEAVLAELVRAARAEGVARLVGTYRPTARNALVREHYRKLGFAPAGEEPGGATRWTLETETFAEPELPMRRSRPAPVP